MEASDKKCYICDEIITGTFEDIFAGYTYTKHSRTLLCDVLEAIITRPLIKSESNLGCATCVNRINKYDFGVTISKQMQKEIRKILEKTELKYITNITTADSDEDEEEEEDDLEIKHDVIGDYSDDTEEIAYVITNTTKEEYISDTDELIETLIEEHIESDDEISVHNMKKEEELIISDDADNDTNDFQFANLPSIDIVEIDMKPHKVTERKQRLINYCKECKVQLASKEEYREHRKEFHTIIPIESNSAESNFVCDVCGSNFRTRSRLTVHSRIHDEMNPFKCEICGKQFTQRGALKRHQPIHTGEKPYQCEKCGKQFIHYSSFHMHNLAHDDVREKECTICGLKLRSNSHLNRHMRVHTGAKPHECPKCGQRFAQRYNMNVHLRSHEGINRKRTTYKCEICSEKYTKLYLLNEHKTLYHDVVQIKTKIETDSMETDEISKHIYQCEICQETFQKLNLLNEHNNIYHNNEIYENVLVSTEPGY